jgi:putative phage-type endonuclease
LEQNTTEWLEWRRKGLGASDACIVMGVSEYKTRRQLWENKLKLRPDDEESYITELGHKFEPKARARFALESGIDLKADVCIVHDEFPYLRASLDGHCEKERVFAEIKMVGKKKMEWLKANKVPLPEHFPQVQQQFLVTKYERGFYIAYCLNDDKTEIVDYIAFPVQPDRGFIPELFKELTAFWKLVETQTPPET